MSVKQKLGGRYIQWREAAGMFGELQGRSRDVAEGFECALEGHEKLADVEATLRRGAYAGLRQEHFWSF